MFTIPICHYGANNRGKPTRSLSMASASNQYLSMTQANFVNYNRAKWAYSVWYKRSTTGAAMTFMAIGTSSDSATEFYIQINSSNKINFSVHATDGTLGSGGILTTTATFTDTSSFHHLLLYYDSANATANSKMRMWHDGTEITSFTTRQNPTTATYTATGQSVQQGAIATANKFNGLLYQPAFFSGSLPDISTLYNAGAALDVTGLTGLASLLNTKATGALEDDYVLTPNWTNNGTVTKSTTIP